MLIPSVVKLQVPELRKALKERGLASEGLKKVLVVRLQTALKNEEVGEVKELKEGQEPAILEPTAHDAPNTSACVSIRQHTSGSESTAGDAHISKEEHMKALGYLEIDGLKVAELKGVLQVLSLLAFTSKKLLILIPEKLRARTSDFRLRATRRHSSSGSRRR